MACPKKKFEKEIKKLLAEIVYNRDRGNLEERMHDEGATRNLRKQTYN